MLDLLKNKQKRKTEAQKEMLSEVLETSLATKSDIDRLDKQIVVLKWMMGVMLAGVVSLVMKAFFIPLAFGEILNLAMSENSWKVITPFPRLHSKKPVYRQAGINHFTLKE